MKRMEGRPWKELLMNAAGRHFVDVKFAKRDTEDANMLRDMNI